MKKLILSILLYFVCSSSSYAFIVWVVDSGAPPLSYSKDTFQMEPGETTFDLYYDVEGDTSYGYDMFLDVQGAGSISNVSGGDSDLGNATASGWHQLGGDVSGETGNAVLGFSFDFTGEAGSLISVSGIYTDINFSESLITSSTLVSVSNVPNVPIPSALWLFSSALIGLVNFKRRS